MRDLEVYSSVGHRRLSGGIAIWSPLCADNFYRRCSVRWIPGLAGDRLDPSIRFRRVVSDRRPWRCARVQFRQNVEARGVLGSLFVACLLIAMAPPCASQSTKSESSIIAEPRLLLGDGVTEYAFEFPGVAGAFRLNTGEIVAGDAAANTVVILDATGRAVRSFGRRGAGPGEFERLTAVLRVGDSIVARDSRGIHQLFAPSGGFVRALPRFMLRGAEGAIVHGYLSDGTAVVSYRTTSTSTSKRTAWFNIKRTLVLVGRRDTVMAGEFIASRARASKSGRLQAEVFAPQGHVVVLPDAACVGQSARLSIQCYDAAGKRTINVALPPSPPRPVTEMDRQAYLDGIAIANPGERGRPYREEVARTTQFATNHAPYGRLLGGRDGTLWVGPVVRGEGTLGALNPLPEDSTLWQVFDSRGQSMGSVRLPPKFRLLEAGREYALGVSQNAEGNDVVQLLRVKSAKGRQAY